MLRLNIWCLLRDQFAHVKPVEAALGDRAAFHYDATWEPAALVQARPDLVLCVNDYQYDVVRCLDAARQAGIPSLTLQDGILEWRCQYENPLFGAGGGAPQHQPVMADKIACLGRQSARQIAAWGNAGKVEVTGMPRLDALRAGQWPPVRTPGTRVLVMTAKNPGFTPAQRDVTLQSLRDVQQYLATQPHLEVLWRVGRSVAEALRVENQMQEISTLDLVRVLERADAVITTPSTAMLEAMVLGRPVAALDYHNVPRFVPTAWTIAARDHIQPVLAELLSPPLVKMAFQRDCLADCLWTGGAAADRVATLMTKMVELARGPQRLPANLLDGAALEHSNPPALQELYAEQSVFRETDLRALQVRLARAENENLRLKNQQAARSAPARLLARLRRWVGK
jgi:hypothetical protein